MDGRPSYGPEESLHRMGILLKTVDSRGFADNASTSWSAFADEDTGYFFMLGRKLTNKPEIERKERDRLGGNLTDSRYHYSSFYCALCLFTREC